jgi:Fe-S-cluster containining protein
MEKKKCGSCSVCCVAPPIVELEKPTWETCKNLVSGCKGCLVYEDRPKSCRTFDCAWRRSPNMPSRFRPDRCGIMLSAHRNGLDKKVLRAWEYEASWENSRLRRWVGSFLHEYEIRVSFREKELV